MRDRSPAAWLGISYLTGLSFGLLEASLMRNHYLLDSAIPRWALTVLLANFYGFALSSAAASALVLKRLFGERGRRLGSERWPAAAVAAAAALGICGQLYLWSYHVSHGEWGKVVLVVLVGLGVAVFAGGLFVLSFLAGIAGERPRRPFVAGSFAVAVALLAAFSFHRFRVDHDLRLLLFDKTYLTGVVCRLAYVAADFDGDGFAPRWIGGDDPNNFDPSRNVLTGVTPLQPSRPLIPRLPQPLGENTNLLLITADALSAHHLGVYGAARDTSPTIDRLARGGVRFHDAIVQWSETSESFASILTGTYPHTHGVLKTQTPVGEDLTLLAERFLEAGFSTAAFVENANLAPVFNFDQGFETYVYLDSQRDVPGPTAAALAWLAEHHRQRFFLWLHYLDPHGPYQAPPPFYGTFAHVGSRPFCRYHVHPAFRTRSSDLLDYVDRYDEEIRGIDAQVGRIVAFLEERGLRGNTLLVFTSDHGESFSHSYFASHGRYSYDDLIRVPLVWNLPGTLAPREVLVPVESVDLVPTLLDLFGLPIHDEVEGRSFAARLLGMDVFDPSESYAFSESGYLSPLNPVWRRKAVRTQKWKYVWTPGFNVHELYDLENDPAESDNVFDPRDETSQRLQEVLLRWVAYSQSRSLHRSEDEAATTPELREELNSLGYVD